MAQQASIERSSAHREALSAQQDSIESKPSSCCWITGSHLFPNTEDPFVRQGHTQWGEGGSGWSGTCSGWPEHSIKIPFGDGMFRIV